MLHAVESPAILRSGRACEKWQGKVLCHPLGGNFTLLNRKRTAAWQAPPSHGYTPLRGNIEVTTLCLIECSMHRLGYRKEKTLMPNFGTTHSKGFSRKTLLRPVTRSQMNRSIDVPLYLICHNVSAPLAACLGHRCMLPNQSTLLL